MTGTFFKSLALAGGLVTAAGLWYLFVKAGIPYQDPTPELALRYEIFHETGKALLRLGLGAAVVGAADTAMPKRFKGNK